MLEYNTQLKDIILPEYGRNIQRMVDYCLTIEDKEERTKCANAIIATMGNLFPHLRDIDDFKHKLWDHIAIMSNFKLDIDYPCEIIAKENLYERPSKVEHKSTPIRYRHYGKFTEQMLKKCAEYPEGEEREQLISLIANYMKKSLYSWNKEITENDKILKDIKEYTKGAIELKLEDLKLRSTKEFQQKKNNNNNNNNRKR